MEIYKSITMPNPYHQDDNMCLCIERRMISYKGLYFYIQFHSYICGYTGQQYTTTELDMWNIGQIYIKYNQIKEYGRCNN